MSRCTSVRLLAVTKVFQPGTSGESAALSNLTVSFESGGLHLVWGPSGSGKTTLLTIVGALDAPTSGDVTIDGLSLGGLSEPELCRLRRHRIGFLFQRPFFFPGMPVWDNVSIGLVSDGFPARRRREIAAGWLERLGLIDKLDRPPELLSGGEFHRVSLARALVADPDVILADEPTAQLDAENSTNVIAILQERAAAGCVVIVTSHDPTVRRSARRLAQLDHGRLIFSGEVSG